MAPAILFLFCGRLVWYPGIWKNEHWVVETFGPTLLRATLATIFPIVAVRRYSAPSSPAVHEA